MKYNNNDLFSDAGKPANVAQSSISVSELNRRVKGVIEANFSLSWVRGELSNVMRAASGHWYFSLKDDAAQVRCVMFKSRADAVSFTPENGLSVEVRGLPSLYEARGEFQLGVEGMRRAGLGALFEAYERLKRKLALEGFFDADRKRALPEFPRVIGIVTSLKAAALRDVLATLKRRAPMISIIIYPTAVQGADAPREIVNAINAVHKRNEIDALLVCRGGGAMEDLWAFNDEGVARAMYRLQGETDIVVVSAIGHETDFTICDFVADMRAPTPTAGAELLSPDSPELLAQLRLKRAALKRGILRNLEMKQQRLDFAARALLSPQERLRQAGERLLQHQQRLIRAHNSAQQRRRDSLSALRLRTLRAPFNVAAYRRDLAAQMLALQRFTTNMLAKHRTRLDQQLHALTLLNPENVLTRGYAIVRLADRQVLTSIANVCLDDVLTIRFNDGEANARVTETLPNLVAKD